MRSILDKKLIKRGHHKRLLGLLVLFILSIFALKSLMDKHPYPDGIPVAVDINKTVEKPIEKPEQVIKKPQKQLSVAQKKQRFKDLLVPAVDSAYAKLDKRYKEIKELLKTDPKNKKIEELKEELKAKSNHDLLIKLKPHPKSVTLAQAAIESAWGTSRFFYKANNVFGVWSYNKNEPRIAASETRGEKKIYLKKYRTIEDSVLDYYKILSKAGAYHKFRVQNYKEPNPYILVTHLDRYSEKRAEYGRILISVIGHNKFTEYDEKFYPRPPKPKKKPEPKVEKKLEEVKVTKTIDTNTSTIKEEVAKVEGKKVDTNISTPVPKQEIKKQTEDSNTSKENNVPEKSEMPKSQNSDTNKTISD